MVRLGIEQLESEGLVKLSDADRVRQVTNLMTVLVPDSETRPVLSVGKGDTGGETAAPMTTPQPIAVRRIRRCPVRACPRPCY